MNAGPGQDRRTAQRTSKFPIGEPKLRRVQRVLAIDPAREAITDEGRIDKAVEGVVRLLVLGDQRGDEPGRVPVDEIHAMLQVIDDRQSDLRRAFSFPFLAQLVDLQARGEAFDGLLAPPLDAGFEDEEVQIDEGLAADQHVQAARATSRPAPG